MLLRETGRDNNITTLSYGECSSTSINYRDMLCGIFPYSHFIAGIGYGVGSNNIQNNFNIVLLIIVVGYGTRSDTVSPCFHLLSDKPQFSK